MQTRPSLADARTTASPRPRGWEISATKDTLSFTGAFYLKSSLGKRHVLFCFKIFKMWTI